MNKIPKIIHYCWFGRNPKNELIIRCIESWKEYLPEYQIIEWNEDNFDITCNDYVEQAYKSKRYAFVSDYARLHAVYNQGGIYLDTDVEITEKFDEFLNFDAFTGFTSWEYPFTAVFGAIPKHAWVADIMDIYRKKHFLNQDNSMNMTTNTIMISKLLIESYGVICNDKFQIVKNGLAIFPTGYFTIPIKGIKNYAIHHFDGSWGDYTIKTGKKKKITFGMKVAIKSRLKSIWPILLPLRSLYRKYSK